MTEITVTVLGAVVVVVVWLLKGRNFRIKAGISGLEIEAVRDEEKDRPPSRGTRSRAGKQGSKRS